MLFNNLEVNEDGFLLFTDRKTKQTSSIKKALIDSVFVPSTYIRQKNRLVQNVGSTATQNNPLDKLVLYADDMPFASFYPYDIALNGVGFKGTFEELMSAIKSLLE